MVQDSKLETLEERRILTTTGTTWRVREARAINVPGAEGPTCLIFDSDKACTRLWRYPAEWRRLSAAELLAIADNPRGPNAD